MRGVILYDPGGVRFEERVAPAIIAPTKAIIRMPDFMMGWTPPDGIDAPKWRC
jgi:hypothetical protein